MKITDKINFKQPKYMLPAILYIPLFVYCSNYGVSVRCYLVALLPSVDFLAYYTLLLFCRYSMQNNLS